MPTKQQWENHWQDNNTPWDLGGVTPSLAAWCADDAMQGQAVLVPGCGRGHDAHFMAKRGAKVTAVDISESALAGARTAYPESLVTWRLGNALQLGEESVYDRIWEYTCLCALEPDMREDYIHSLALALKPGGLYFGLMFHKVQDPENGPPFQMTPDELKALLGEHLTLQQFEEDAPHSVKPRRGAEMWFVAAKP